MKAKKIKSKKMIAGIGQNDNTWKEVNLNRFLADNPSLISNLKKKYSI